MSVLALLIAPPAMIMTTAGLLVMGFLMIASIGMTIKAIKSADSWIKNRVLNHYAG